MIGIRYQYELSWVVEIPQAFTLELFPATQAGAGECYLFTSEVGVLKCIRQTLLNFNFISYN